MNNVDPIEIEKFSKHSKHWWDLKGPLKTLHDINDTRINFIKSHTDLSNKAVLDMGCGGGILTEALAKEGAFATGIDLASESIKVAKKHAVENNLNIDYLDCPLEELSLTKKYDVITCLEMLEHVPDPQAIIKKLCLHLKPKGLLFLSTINRTNKAYLYTIIGAEYLLKIIPKNTHDYKKYIKPSELSSMLRTSNMKIDEIKGLHYNPLSSSTWLDKDIDVNYLAVAKKIENGFQ